MNSGNISENNSDNNLIIFFSIILCFITALAVFGYFGLPTKYYYIIIANYVIFGVYYYYKYSYYNLDSVKTRESSTTTPQINNFITT